jgi:DNA-binding NarL/FixJ family response regulator
MARSLDDRLVGALHRTVTELTRQDGRGISRQTIVSLAAAVDGYELDIYAGDPPLAIARPVNSSLFVRLTRREREIADLLAGGLANGEIAAALMISEATVKDHVHNILRKTGLKTRAAVAGAWRA